jgi:predicted acyl esterase
MGVAALGHPGYAAMNVQGFGAGVGRVGPYYEQGNWYRGGAMQMLFIAWLYGEQNQVRPMFPPDTPREDLIRASKSFDLAQHLPPVDWSKALWHLPVQDIIKQVDGPHGIFADAMKVETGGRMIQRAPNDPAWYRGGLYHDDMKLNVPGLWFMSWYDVSVGPNLGGVARLAEALHAERETPAFEGVHTAYERAHRLAGRAAEEAAPEIDRALLKEEAELALAEGLAKVEADTEVRRALESGATLAPLMERFFDEVLVMDEDEAVRANRLRLLLDVRDALGRLGDFSQIPR